MFFFYLVVYARWILGAILLVAGATKIKDMSEFVLTIQSFRLVPKQLSYVVAPLIIGLELILGSSLLVGVYVRLATVAVALLFGTFIIAILINLVRHNITDCNCFGPYFKEKISGKAVIRNFLFMLLCLWVWQFYDGYLALESRFFRDMVLQNHPLEPFILLTLTIVVSGISILIVRTIVKNFKSTSSNSFN